MLAFGAYNNTPEFRDLRLEAGPLSELNAFAGASSRSEPPLLSFTLVAKGNC